ncbi:MAG: hypothetical protein ACPGVI_04080 [Crocinitomicaceae bacterium]
MKTYINSLLALLTIFSYSHAQSSSSAILEPCNEGANYRHYNSPIALKKFKRKYKVNLKINSIQVGVEGKLENILLDYTEKVKFESSLIQLNDSTAVQVQLTRTMHNNDKHLYFRLKVLYKDDMCWRQTSMHHFEPVRANSMGLGIRSSGGIHPIPRVTLENIILVIE